MRSSSGAPAFTLTCHPGSIPRASAWVLRLRDGTSRPVPVRVSTARRTRTRLVRPPPRSPRANCAHPLARIGQLVMRAITSIIGGPCPANRDSRLRMRRLFRERLDFLESRESAERLLLWLDEFGFASGDRPRAALKIVIPFVDAGELYRQLDDRPMPSTMMRPTPTQHRPDSSAIFGQIHAGLPAAMGSRIPSARS